MEEQNKTEATQVTEEKKRPVFLSVLCILTFIGSGIALLFSLIGLVASGAVESLSASIPGMPDLDHGFLKTLIMVLLVAGSLFGAILMWQLKKVGFYIYAAANVILLFISFGWFALIFTAAFIIMYGVNLKAME